MQDSDKNTFTPFKLRNRHISDILNDPPHWFVRIGGFLMLLLVVVIIGICMLIKYPDTIKQDVIYHRSTELFYATMPYSTLSASVPMGTTVKIELDNRPKQQYGYIIGILSHKFFSSKEQTYTFSIKPQHGDVPSLNSLKKVCGTATIVVRDQTLLQRFWASIKF